MPYTAHGCDHLLYGNVRIRCIKPDPAACTLMIKAVYADHQEQKILYSGVLYSQLDESAEGKRIALAVELTPEEYRHTKHQNSAMRFQEECRLQNLDSLDEMTRCGYRLFLHYAGERDEYVVIAKSLSVF